LRHLGTFMAGEEVEASVSHLPPKKVNEGCLEAPKTVRR